MEFFAGAGRTCPPPSGNKMVSEKTTSKPWSLTALLPEAAAAVGLRVAAWHSVTVTRSYRMDLCNAHGSGFLLH